MVEQAEDTEERKRAEEMRKALRFMEFKSYWSRVIVDEYGYIWASIPTDIFNALESYKLFSSEGEYLGDTTWPGGAWAISRGQVLVMQDYLVGGTPVIYRIISKVDGFEFP